ncbi:MAG: hypothetical protein OEQ74_12255, partial [Gammaproteobacteria bacterium]|nr:hypothetical protein [Gammaproteobacteria bacterium]
TGQPRQDTNTGSAYLFRRNTGGPDNWGEIVKLTASDGQLGDDFGRAVAISGDTAVVGARFTDGSGPFSGSAYVYVRSPAEAELWIESRKLTSRNAGTNAYFGEDVAIEGPVIVAGAPGDLFGSGPAGAAYVFTSSVFGWNETEVLAGSTGEPGDRFGASVAISGNTIAVGAFGSDVDRVFVFERIPDTFDWAETAMLTTPCGAINSEFGQAIAIKDDLLVIGAPFDDEAAENAGAIFVYERNTGGPNQWGFVAKVISTDSSTLDQFGVTVAVSNDAVSTGAPGNDTAGTDGGSAYSAELYALDTDADGVSDTLDNCLATQNGPETVAETGPSQRDTDADGFGNMCDADLNNDCMIDFHDLGIMRIVFGATDENADFNGDGAVDFIDLGLMAGMFLSAPGPSATQSCDSSAVPPPQQHGELQIITSLNCEAP